MLPGDRRDSLRIQARWERAQSWEWTLAADASRVYSELPFAQPRTDFFGLPRAGLPLAPRRVQVNTPARSDTRLQGVSLRGVRPWGEGELTWISAWRDTDQARRNDTDYGPEDLLWVDYQDRYRQGSQEWRWVLDAQASVRGVVGVYVAREQAATDRKVFIGQDTATRVPVPGVPVPVPFGPSFGLAPGLGARTQATVDTTTLAAFGQLDVDLGERWTLGVGGRATRERKALDWNLDGAGSGALQIATLATRQSRTDSKFSPRVSVVFRPRERWQVYATASQGFKAGGWNVDFLNRGQVAAGFGFDPETVRHVEAGVKAVAMGRRLDVDVVAYRSRYADFQVFQFVNLGAGASVLQLTNAAQATSEGLEATVRWRAAPGLTLGGAIGQGRARFDVFDQGTASGASLAGKRLPDAPDRTLAAWIQGSKETASGYWDTTLAVNYRSESFVAATNLPGERIAPHTNLDASLAYTPAHGRWRARVFARNLLNRDHVEIRARDFFGHEVERYNAPRSVGAEWQMEF